ncbi:hypothetical protein [Amycolatopsis rifamycinica]|uniref:Transposase n=1 Tax=Amycolatopsis rifamycinica TaxID=287986 RepID=A0A066TWB3_9PSEU|nr:hypothetical protein [Amycolatopsis rifamycinica]KDN16263.1 hypothetical protein DV20_42660 [Amycolatopsis rifamycinica]
MIAKKVTAAVPELFDVLRRVLPQHARDDMIMPSKLCLAEVAWVPAKHAFCPLCGTPCELT